MTMLVFVTIMSNNISNAGVSREEIIGNSMLMLLAGYETTSGAMQFLVYNLAVYQECQEKLRKEIKDTVKKHVSRDFMLKFETSFNYKFAMCKHNNFDIFKFSFVNKNQAR